MLVDKLQSICEFCAYGEVKTENSHMNKGYFVIPSKKFAIYCNYTLSYVRLFHKECPKNHYRPKVGKIGKNLYQKQLNE